MAVAMTACSVRTQFIDNCIRRDYDKSIRYEASSSFVASKSLRILQNLRFPVGNGGGSVPSSAITSGALQSSNRSYKRSNNPHGGQSRVNPPPVNSAESNGASTVRAIPNGAHTQQSPGYIWRV